MTDFAAGTVRALDDLAVNDNATADSGSKRDHDDGIHAFSAALPLFAERSDIGVISRTNLHVKKIAELIFDVFLSPVQIYRYRDHAPHDRSWNADAHSDDIIFSDLFDRHFGHDRCRNVGEDIFSAVFSACRDLPLVDQSSALLKESALHSCSADIDSKTVFTHLQLPRFFIIFSCTRLLSSCTALYPIFFWR